MLEGLKATVCDANLKLHASGLIALTWGNVSGIDRERGLVVIKPSGVDYADLTPDRMAVVDLDGNKVEGGLNPSSDTPTHLAIYHAFAGAGGIAHTHSDYASAFAQALREIPCLGTTHADHFYGSVPVTRPLSAEEIVEAYEVNTGKVIVDRFKDLDPRVIPAVLVAHHGPFTWGPTPLESIKNSIALEKVAKMALDALSLDPATVPIPNALLDKHFLRKHGGGAYYGQVQI